MKETLIRTSVNIRKTEGICRASEKAEEGLNTLKTATNEDQILQGESVNTVLLWTHLYVKGTE